MKSVQRWATVLAAALVAACGGSGDGGTAAQVDGAIVKGPVTGATVCAFALTGGAKGRALTVQATSPGGVVTNGCFVTGADGAYAFTVPGYSGEILLEATGGNYCSDENPLSNGACTGGGAVVALNETMTAAASVSGGTRSTTYVTPLTTAAVGVAAANGGITVDAFRGRFATLAGTVIGNSGVTPSSVPTAATQPYLAQVAQFVRNGGKLSSAVASLQQGSTAFSSTGGSNPGGTTPGGTTSPATVNAALAGAYSLVFKKGGGSGCGTVCSYTDGQTVDVTVHADGRLVIGALSLSNPFYRSYGGQPNLHEVIWLDSANNIEYALSDNAEPHFNEINVGNVATASGGVPGFIGQIRMAQQSGAVSLAPLAGTFPLAYQYSGPPVAWTSVTIGTDGAVTFNGGSGPSATAAQVTEINEYLSCCGNVQIKTSNDFNSNDDDFRVYRDNAGATRSIEYYVGNGSGINTNKVGVRLGTVQALPAPAVTVPAGAGIAGTFGGTDVTSSTFANASKSDNSFFIDTMGGTSPGMGVQISLPAGTPITPGTYACEASPTRQIQISGRATAGAVILTPLRGGRCSIVVDTYTGTGSTGRFVAELVGDSQDGTPAIVQGAFNYGN